MSSIGDVILTSPLIRQLRQKYPRAQIDFVIRREYAELVRFNPHLSQVIEFDVRDGFAGLRRLKHRLRRKSYDVILDVHRNLRSLYLTALFSRLILRRPRVCRIRKNQLLRFLLVKLKMNLYRKIYGEIISVRQKYLRTASCLGIAENDERLEFFLPEEVERKAEAYLQQISIGGEPVVIAPGARHFTKRWPPEYFAQVITALFQQFGKKTVLVGGSEDLPVTEEILRQVPEGAAYSAAGRLSLAETAGIIRRALLVISNDSGIMHLAEALNRPLIAIFGSTVREFGFFPQNARSVVLEKNGLSCRPCSHIGRASCPKKHFKCMRDILPEQVLRVIEQNFFHRNDD